MADVSSTLANWSTTRGSNGPSGSAIAGAGIDDNLREIQGTVRGAFAHIGPDISVASTMDLGAVEGSTHNTLGTGTVTSFGTISAGIRKRLIVGGATLTITHNATSMICPGAASLSLVTGDVVEAESLGGGNWRITGLTRYSGKPTVANLASEITSSASGRMVGTNVNTALAQVESLASPGYSFITVAGTNTLTGTANALFSTSISTGEVFSFVPGTTNTATVEINVNGTGARGITKNGNIPLAAGDLVAGQVYEMRYDGTRWQLLNPSVPVLQGLSVSGASTLTGAVASGAITATGRVRVPNQSAFASVDSGGNERNIAYIGPTDIVFIEGSAGGLALRTNNGATTALSVSNTGKINSGSLVGSAAEVKAAATNVLVTPSNAKDLPFAAKAWVNFNNDGSVREAYNCTITRNGTGDYSLTFTAAMANSTYVIIAMPGGDYGVSNRTVTQFTNKSTTGFRILYVNEAGSAGDINEGGLVVFGTLA